MNNETRTEKKEWINNLISNEIFCLANNLIETWIAQDENQFEYDEAVYDARMYRLDGEMFSLEELEDMKEELEAEEIVDEETLAKVEDTIDGDGEMPEIMQWFLVSNWLAEKLKQHNHVVLQADEYVYAWGRQSYGGGLEQDPIFSDIYDDLLSK